MTIIFTFYIALKNKILHLQGRAKLNTDKDAKQRKNGFFCCADCVLVCH